MKNLSRKLLTIAISAILVLAIAIPALACECKCGCSSSSSSEEIQPGDYYFGLDDLPIEDGWGVITDESGNKAYVPALKGHFEGDDAFLPEEELEEAVGELMGDELTNWDVLNLEIEDAIEA